MTEPIRITSLKLAGERCRLTVSTMEEPLILSTAMVHRHRLKEGIVITAPQLAQLLDEAAADECELLIRRMLAFREHSVGEVTEKLRHKGCEDTHIEKAVAKFVRTGLLDDARYADSLIRRLLERKPAGRNVLVAELQAKRIERNLAQRIVDDLLADRSETDLAIAALESRWRAFAQFDVETARQKAYTFLSRRGIGYAAAKAAFETLLSRTNEDTNHQDRSH
jgi:SOS response regulatory protein OraA/RecX